MQASKRYSPKDLELPDDEPMVIIRSSFLWICDGDKYAAAALNMYVHWTRWLMKHRPVAQQMNRLRQKQGKKPNQDTSLILYRKQAALVKDLLGFCSEKRLRQANDLLISKGLLKIDDTPRSISDHVLKYELQIDVFKELIQQWKDQRKAEDEFEDDVVEVALEDDSDGTDNLPPRSGTFTASSSVRNGKFTDRNGKNAASNNRENQRDDSRDNQERENTPSRSSQFTSEQLRIDTLYCALSDVTQPPTITDQLKKYWDKLAHYIVTQEEMISLYDHTKRDCATKKNKRVYPGNLADCVTGWHQEEEEKRTPLPWSQPSDKQPETTSVEQPTHHEGESLPTDMQMWMADTTSEFGGDETTCVNELEWCFQHATCSEEEFYSKLIHAYEKARKEKSVDMFFAELKQDLLLVVEAIAI